MQENNRSHSAAQADAPRQICCLVRYRKAIIAFAVLALCLILALGYWFGYSRGTDALTKANANCQMYDNQAKFFSDKSRQYYDELISYRSKFKVAQSSLDDLTEVFKKNQSDMADQKEELLFYRQIVVPDKSGKRLKLHEIKLYASDQPHIYHFQVVLVQTQRRKETLSGQVEFLVHGQLAGAYKTLNWDDLQVENATEAEFNFRYFQRIDGYVKLPPDFEPEQMTLKVRMKSSRRRSKPEIEAKFPWISLL